MEQSATEALQYTDSLDFTAFHRSCLLISNCVQAMHKLKEHKLMALFLNVIQQLFMCGFIFTYSYNGNNLVLIYVFAR